MRGLVLLLAVLLAGCTQGGPEPQVPPPSAFGVTGEDCTVMQASVAVEAQVVRALVPDRFRIVGEAAGAATVTTLLLDCGRMAVDGPAGRGATAMTGVAVQPPDEDGGMHLYLLWMPSDREDLRLRTAALDVRGGAMAVPTVLPSLHELDEVRLGDIQASVPWHEGPYGLRIDVAGPTAGHLLDGAPWWHLGAQGAIRIGLELEGQAWPGVARIQADEGPMQDLLGPASAGPGSYGDLRVGLLAEPVRLP